MASKIMVVGGAGYIGSCCAKMLAEDGFEPVVYDNLTSGHRELVKFGPLVQGDIRDGAALDEAFRAHRPRSVLHFAAKSIVRDSVQAPLDYYDNNVAGSLSLLQACLRHDVETFVFSSTAAVYGAARTVPIPLTAPLAPVNPYGMSKLTVERVLADVVTAHPHLGATVFRYFNAAGAHPDGEVGEWHEPETHLIPTVLGAVLQGEPMPLYGDDYDTVDGTGVRDYVHVVDLVRAHINALIRPASPGEVRTYNLGSGSGFSVKQVVEACGRVIGRTVNYTLYPRRPGDPATLVAGDLDRVEQQLGWRPEHSRIDEIVADAWKWQQQLTR